MIEATIYNWLRQDRIDRGEIQVTSTDMALNLASRQRAHPKARDEARLLARAGQEVFLKQSLAAKRSLR